MQPISSLQIKVTIEVSQPDSWERKILAKAEVNDTATVRFEELANEVRRVVDDAKTRALRQVSQTTTIMELEDSRRVQVLQDTK